MSIRYSCCLDLSVGFVGPFVDVLCQTVINRRKKQRFPIKQRDMYRLFQLLLLSLLLRLTFSNEEEWLVKIKTATKAGVSVLNQKLSDEQEGTLLIVAAREGYYSAVEQLLKIPSVDKDVQDDKGHSALMAAIVSSYTSSSLIATSIIKAQCNVNLLDVEGKDALMLSAAKGLLSVVELLLVQKAIATNTDQDGWTCLHHAAANNHATIVEVLLRNPDVTHNTRAKNGQTALHLCASRGHVAVCSVLLQHSNSSVDRHDASGLTPLLLAIQAQHVDMVTTYYPLNTYTQHHRLIPLRILNIPSMVISLSLLYFSDGQVGVLLKGHAHVNVVSRRHDESQGESPLMAGDEDTSPTLTLSTYFSSPLCFSLLLLL